MTHDEFRQEDSDRRPLDDARIGDERTGEERFGDERGADAEPPLQEAVPQRAETRPRVPTIVAAAGAAVLVLSLLAGLLWWRLSGGDPEDLGPQQQATPTPSLSPRSGTPAPVQEAKVGQRVTIQGLYGRGTVMVTQFEWSDRGDLPPGPGKKYLNVELRYDCAEGALQTNKNMYAAYDMKKQEHFPGIGSGKDPLPDTEIRPGAAPLTGWVSIEMVPDQTLFVISDEGINPLVIVDLPRP